MAHQVTTSLGGRRNNQLIDTAGPGLVDPNPAGGDFVYDGAGRLTAAFLNGARADYGYAANLPAEGCANPAMGADTNRTSVTTTPTTGAATVSRSCYDKADRLVSTSAGGPVSSSYGYDGHGNATTDAATTLAYDAADRLTGVASAATTVSYVRDALDRVVSRTEGATVTRYAHGGFTDAPVAVLDGASTVTQTTVPLPGGATLTVQATGDVWSYPDMAGHLVATANAAGTRQGTPVTYDPWGAEYPARPPVDNAPGNADFGAFGAAAKLEEHATPTPIVLMGARPYSPTQARFLSVDPVQGGCANNYTYVHGDPVNTNDLSGRIQVPGNCGVAFLEVQLDGDVRFGFRNLGMLWSVAGYVATFSDLDSGRVEFEVGDTLNFNPFTRSHTFSINSDTNPLIVDDNYPNSVGQGGLLNFSVTVDIWVIGNTFPYLCSSGRLQESGYI